MDGPLSKALSAAGLSPVCEPVIESRILGDAAEEIALLGPNDWLVLTSARSIQTIVQPEARVPRVAVVGEVSAALAREWGLRVEFISPTYESGALWEHIAHNLDGVTRVCYPRSSRAQLPSALVENPAVELLAPIVYDTRDRQFDHSVVQHVDIAAFASPSAVQSVIQQLGRLDIPAASLGPTTGAVLRSVGVKVVIEPTERSFASLAKAIANQTWKS